MIVPTALGGLLLCDPNWLAGIAPLRNGVFAGKVSSNISGLKSLPKVTFFLFAGFSELSSSVWSMITNNINYIANPKRSKNHNLLYKSYVSFKGFNRQLL